MAQLELQLSGPFGLRTPIHVAARQNLSRSPTANVLLVPSVMCFIEIWLLPKKMPLLLQRAWLPTGQFELMIPFDPT